MSNEPRTFQELVELYNRLSPREQAAWMAEHRQEWQDARERHDCELRRRERTEKAEARKKRREELQRERVEQLPTVMVGPPRDWVLDGSYAALSDAAKKLSVAVYAVLDPTGLAAQVTREALGDLAGMSTRSVTRGLRELHEGGWVVARWKYLRAKRAKILWLSLPPGGVRKPKKEADE